MHNRVKIAFDVMLLREAQKNSAAAAAVAAAGGVPVSSNISQVKKRSPSSQSLFNFKDGK